MLIAKTNIGTITNELLLLLNTDINIEINKIANLLIIFILLLDIKELYDKHLISIF